MTRTQNTKATRGTVESRHRILLVDDDSELLELYGDVLLRLPSRPEVFTASTGARAMAMLESQPFRLLICDLRMPKMDGLQVLSICRRKYPNLRTVAITGLNDEHFRSRAYSLGVDLFWHKPANEGEVKMFSECLESLLGREGAMERGFRGVQSKSLVDIIQLECISQSSAVLRITNGTSTGKIWIQDGEVVDAAAGDLGGEAGFNKILRWKAGSFESMTAEPNRPRTIFKSYSALLLETAQALDESAGVKDTATQGEKPVTPLSHLSQVDGMEFVVATRAGENTIQGALGLENPELMASWSRQNLERFRALGERLQAGQLDRVLALGPQRNVVIAEHAGTELCLGCRPSMNVDEIQEMTRKVFSLWAS